MLQLLWEMISCASVRRHPLSTIVVDSAAKLVADSAPEQAGQPVQEVEDLEIWFSSRPARLVRAPGTTERFVPDIYVEDASETALKVTVSRGEALTAPDGGAPVTVPAMPCLELGRNNSLQPDALVEERLPPELEAPLIKSALQGQGPCVPAFASGVRSALVPLGGVVYRLKGCGNGDGPFVIRTTHAKTGARREVRGSAFVHTGRRELFVAQELTRALSASGCICGNIPVALWRYGAEVSPFGESELLATACAVERTLGDRRLGTHVLAGLQLLLPHLTALSSSAGEASGGEVPPGLLALFPTCRPSGVEVTTAQLMTDAMLAFELGTGHGLQFEQPREPRLFANAVRAGEVLRECAPPPATYPNQWTQDGCTPMAPRWQARFESARRQYEGVLSELRASSRREVSVLGYTYARIGHECALTPNEQPWPVEASHRPHAASRRAASHMRATCAHSHAHASYADVGSCSERSTQLASLGARISAQATLVCMHARRSCRGSYEYTDRAR